MPFYKVPAVTSNDNGPKRIRAPLRHSVNNGGGAGVATTSRDCDVISSDSTVSADKSKLQTRHSDQVVLKPLVQQDRLAAVGTNGMAKTSRADGRQNTSSRQVPAMTSVDEENALRHVIYRSSRCGWTNTDRSRLQDTSAVGWIRRGDEGNGDGDGVGQRWKGLTGRRAAADGELGRDDRGDGLIAREIREQRERELQLLAQRRQAVSADNSDVTSSCRDDVSVTSSSIGDPETETRRDDDVTVRGQLCRSRVAHQSRLATESEKSQKAPGIVTAPLHAPCSRQKQLEAEVVDGSAGVARCPDVDDGKPGSSVGQPVDTTTQTTSTTLEKLSSVRLKSDDHREQLRERKLSEAMHDERRIPQAAPLSTADSRQICSDSTNKQKTENGCYSTGQGKGRLPRESAKCSPESNSTQRPSLIEKEIQELRVREEELRKQREMTQRNRLT